jgi:hypothetical protein
MLHEEIQLSCGNSGHFLNSTQVFSADDNWIVYDGRLQDHLLAANDHIAMINRYTGEEQLLYRTTGQSPHGPGVGVASFSPAEDEVVFIHGIRNADASRPYSFTRRSGVSVRIEQPCRAVWMDARNIHPPFTNGALRGGTHAHTWSHDGKWIAFTYNDYVLEQAAKRGDKVCDLRTIGLMIKDQPVWVPEDESQECYSGTCYSVLLAGVTETPAWGSDEIEKAFDETWIGSKGYRKESGHWQTRAIAYQGIVRDLKGQPKTEIFVADIPDNLLQQISSDDLRGTTLTRPKVPDCIQIRRISFLEKGVAATPRHWLRSNGAGTHIAFLATDEKGLVRLCTIGPNGGEIAMVSTTEFSVQGPFNFSSDGKWLTYIADYSVFISHVEEPYSIRLTKPCRGADQPFGAPHFSNDGRSIVYNRMIEASDGANYAQIFLIELNREWLSGS